MKSILQEKPKERLSGRLLASADYIDDEDIRNKKVLDIGCCYRWCAINLLKRGARGVVGLETSENDLETVRENVSGDGLDLAVGEAAGLPLKNEVFDTVVSWEVIEHIPKNNEDLMFSEANRVLNRVASSIFPLLTALSFQIPWIRPGG